MATWGSADYRQLERLRENLAKLQGADMDKFCTDVSRELAGRLLALVIPRTPVGRKPTLEQLGGKEAKATVKTKLRDAQGRLRTRSFLSREGAILQQYWSGYMGGTLRRGWTAKNEEAAAKPGIVPSGASAPVGAPVVSLAVPPCVSADSIAASPCARSASCLAVSFLAGVGAVQKAGT